MDVYIYQAALLCESCGDAVRASLTAEGKAPADLDDEESYDSDEFPKGPVADGGGEADSAQHCDACHAFLENPLTADGETSVLAAIRKARLAGSADSVAITQWEPFYDGLPEVPHVARRVYEIAGVEPFAKLPACAWPGGYTVLYLTKRGESACAECASAWGDGDDPIAHAGTFDEGPPETCCECGETIESSYGEVGGDAESRN